MFLYKHKKFSKEIEKQVADLKKSNNWRGSFALMEDIAILFIATILSVKFFFLYPLSIFIIGSRMRGLASLLHDSAHKIIAKNRVMNSAIGLISGYAVFQLPSIYEASHVRDHHLFLGDPQKDPDYQYHLKEGLYQNMDGVSFLKKYVFSVIFFQKIPSVIVYLVKNRFLGSLSQLKNSTTKKEFFGLLFFWGSTIGMCIYLHTLTLIFFFWIVPFIVTFPIVGWFCELGEHYPLITTKETDMEISRNRLGNRLERFFFGVHCDHMHAEHHLNPAIPFWNLNKAREIRLQDPEYFAWDQNASGIFTKGANGNPSILEQLYYFNQDRFLNNQ